MNPPLFFVEILIETEMQDKQDIAGITKKGEEGHEIF